MSVAKDYLGRIAAYDKMINARLAKRQRLLEAATRTTSVMRDDGAQTGGGYRDKISERMERRKHREVLYKCYIEGKPLRLVQKEMGYTSYWGICKLHGRALVEVEKLMGAERAAENG